MNYLVLIVQLVIIIYFALTTCVLITINNILYRITTRSSQKNKKFDTGVNLRLRWVYFDLNTSTSVKMGKLVRIQIWKAGGASVTYDRKVKGKRKNRRLNVATRNKEDKIGVWESICEKLDQHELVVMIHQVFASYTHFQRVCFCGRINPTSQLS